MSEDRSLRRQWLLLKALSARRNGLTVREMATEMGVCAKTIRRDLQLFQEIGFPLEQATGEFGRKVWRLNKDSNNPPLSFDFQEALALYMGRHLMQPLAGTLFWDAAQSAIRKIRATLGEQALSYVERFAGLFHHTAIGASDYSGKGDLVDVLMVGIEDQKVLQILYRSERATEKRAREVHPYGMAYHHGSLYLIAYAPEHGQIRHYKVDRIDNVEIQPLCFERPIGFDLTAHLAGSFGIYGGAGAITVRARFLPQVARSVLESKWHHSQQFTIQKDGSVVAEFRLSHTAEIKSWLMGFGARAIVLEPEYLRREIFEELQLMISSYEVRSQRERTKPPAVPGPPTSLAKFR